MSKVVTVEEMRAIEAEANENGTSYEAMMEAAGRGVAQAVIIAHSHAGTPAVLGLVGSGNNGGDTLIALELLAKAGWRAKAYLAGHRPEGERLSERLTQAGGEITSAMQDQDFHQLAKLIEDSQVLLDGVLGTGIRLPLREDIAQILMTTKQTVERMPKPPRVVAVDCPSGVDCDSGAAAEQTIPADLTVCMHALKIGLLNIPASRLVGEIHLVPIGLKEPGLSDKNLKRGIADPEWTREALPKRPRDAHKGTFGTVLIAAGSVNYTGAALLAGKAAYRVGAGLVTLAVPAPLHAPLAGHFPEATWLLLPHEQGVIADGAQEIIYQNSDRATAFLIGPGWGQEETTRLFLSHLLDEKSGHKRGNIGFMGASDERPLSNGHLPPLVVDADGLKLLTKIPDWAKKLPKGSILTPHPGEMAILTGEKIDAIQARRVQTAEKYAQEWGQIVVLKGAYTVIAEPGGETMVIPVATPALARAGTGDVLAGMIAGLLAQKMPAFHAAVTGAWLHAACGQTALNNLGNAASVLAGDVLAAIPQVITEINKDDLDARSRSSIDSSRRQLKSTSPKSKYCSEA